MKIQRASSSGFECPRLTAYQLPAKIVERAANGLCWVSLIGAVTSAALTCIEHLLQPEFAAAWAHPVLRITSLCVFLLSVGFIAVQRSGWLSKTQLLDLGIVFQVAVAFSGGLFEGAAYKDRNAVVVGVSGNRPLDDAVWALDAECAAEVRPYRRIVHRDVAPRLLCRSENIRLRANADVADAGLGAAAVHHRNLDVCTQ